MMRRTLLTAVLTLAMVVVIPARTSADARAGWADGWRTDIHNGAAVTFQQDLDVSHSGTASLKVINGSFFAPNVYGTIAQSVNVKPSTTYVGSAWIKAENTSRGQFTLPNDWVTRWDVPNGTYDWQEFAFTYTTAANETNVNFRLIVQDLTTGFWLDDVSLAEQGQTTNLLANTGFEPTQQDEELLARYDAMQAKLPALDELLSRAEAQGIAVDYERAKYQTIVSTLPYNRDDVTAAQTTRAAYAIGVDEQLYDEAWRATQSYLDGTATPKVAWRYDTGTDGLTNVGRKFMGRATTATGETQASRPIQLNGFGHFDEVARDIPYFRDLGINAGQLEIGPNSTVFEPDKVNYGTSISDAAATSFTRDTSQAHSGAASMKATSSTITSAMLYQQFVAEPSSTYEMSLWVKATNATNVALAAGFPPVRVEVPSGTYDWQRITFRFTTGRDSLSGGVGLRFEGPTTALRMDDWVVTKVGGSDNLFQNPGFEALSPGDFAVDTALVQRIDRALTAADRADVSVNLLLSPHYLPEWAFRKWPELRINNGGWIGYDINNDHAREILRAHITATLNVVKRHPSLHSIVLSNEPIYVDSRPSAITASMWHDWLRSHYPTVEAMNATWGTSYASYDDVPVNSGNLTATPEYYDWYSFNSTMFADFHKWMGNVVHSVAPEQPVHAKVMPLQNWNRDYLVYGVDLEKFSGVSDIHGNDNYSVIEWGTEGAANAAGFYELQASFGAKPIYNTEDHIIVDGDANYAPIIPQHVRHWLWNGAIHGRTGSTHWVWATMFNMFLVRPDATSAVSQTSLDLNRLAPEVTAFQERQSKVAILHSAVSNIYTTGGQHLAARNLAYRALIYDGQDATWVSESQAAAGKLASYELVVLPRTTHVSAETLAALADYVEQGGQLVTIGDDVLSRDEHNAQLDSATRDAVLSDATIYPADVGFPVLRDGLFGVLTSLGLAEAVLVDADTGSPVNSVDYQAVRTADGLLINVANLAQQTTKRYTIEVDGRAVTTPVDELISETTVKCTIEIPALGVQLLRVP